MNSFNLELFRKTYKGPTVRVKLVVMEKTAPYLPTTPFTSSEQVADYFSSLEEEPREVLIAMYLDNKHRALAIEEVSKGTLTASLCEPKAILQSAILANAAAVIFAHNHPSGDIRPSAQDIRITRTLAFARKFAGINVHDHIITGSDGYYSFAGQGQMAAFTREFEQLNEQE